MLSGQEACLRTEWTAAIEPRRYSESRVMAMWTKEGSQEETNRPLLVKTGQSLPLRYSGASANRNPLSTSTAPLFPSLDGIERIPKQSKGKRTTTVKNKTPACNRKWTIWARPFWREQARRGCVFLNKNQRMVKMWRMKLICIYMLEFSKKTRFSFTFSSLGPRERHRNLGATVYALLLLSVYGLWKWGRKFLQVSIYTPFRRRRRRSRGETAH